MEVKHARTSGQGLTLKATTASPWLLQRILAFPQRSKRTPWFIAVLSNNYETTTKRSRRKNLPFDGRSLEFQKEKTMLPSPPPTILSRVHFTFSFCIFSICNSLPISISTDVDWSIENWGFEVSWQKWCLKRSWLYHATFWLLLPEWAKSWAHRLRSRRRRRGAVGGEWTTAT